MKWFIEMFSSTLGRKLVMALTGLFLIAFLLVHLIGNLQLLKSDGGLAFNVYAEFMSTNPIVQTISKVNFALIIGHIVVSALLSLKNRKARGSEGYAVGNSTSSIWSSRNMGILGTIILVFLVIHLKDFWGQMHYGNIPVVLDHNGKEVRNLYALVNEWFHVGWYVALYAFCMIGVAFHLWHGFISAFQTLGLNHLKYNGLISFVGKTFSIIVPALFALIPIMMYLS